MCGSTSPVGDMQIHSLPAGGAFGVAEIEVSPVTAVHKAALCSQTLLYQALHAKLNENDINIFFVISYKCDVIQSIVL